MPHAEIVRQLVAELLKDQFNLELIVRPAVVTQSSGLDF